MDALARGDLIYGGLRERRTKQVLVQQFGHCLQGKLGKRLIRNNPVARELKKDCLKLFVTTDAFSAGRVLLTIKAEDN